MVEFVADAYAEVSSQGTVMSVSMCACEGAYCRCICTHIGPEPWARPEPARFGAGTRELGLTHAVPPWLSGSFLQSVCHSVVRRIVDLTFLSIQYSSAHCHGLERALSICLHLTTGSISGSIDSPILATQHRNSHLPCPAPCLPGRLPKRALPLEGQLGIHSRQSSVPTCQIEVGRKTAELLASLLFWIPHTGQTPIHPRQTGLLHEGMDFQLLHPISALLPPAAHENRVSADIGPDPPGVSHRLHCKPSESQPRKGRQSAAPAAAAPPATISHASPIISS